MPTRVGKYATKSLKFSKTTGVRLPTPLMLQMTQAIVRWGHLEHTFEDNHCVFV